MLPLFRAVLKLCSNNRRFKRNQDEDFKLAKHAYHKVTTSFEYVLVGTDFALAKPENTT